MMSEEDAKRLAELRDWHTRAMAEQQNAVRPEHFSIAFLLRLLDTASERATIEALAAALAEARRAGESAGWDAAASRQPLSEEELPWRCFHCGEVFADRETAADHFGVQIDDIADEPACKLNETEGLLVKMLREAQEELRKFHEETDAATASFYALGAKHTVALREAEEQGYTRGLNDGRLLDTASRRAKPDAGDQQAWQDLVEKDDRTSPEEYPDMALITQDEFIAALAEARRAGESAMQERAAQVCDADNSTELPDERRAYLSHDELPIAAWQAQRSATAIRALTPSPEGRS